MGNLLKAITDALPFRGASAESSTGLTSQAQAGAGVSSEATPPVDPAALAEREAAKRKLLGLINDRFDESSRARRELEIRWYEQMAFYLGEFYLQVNDIAGILEPHDDVPDHRVRAEDNRIRPAVNNLVALQTRSMPTLAAVPATTDPEDYDGARCGTQALRGEWNRAQLTVLDHSVRTTKSIAGTAGVWTRWNTALGQVSNPQDGVQAPSGEIEYLYVSPFSMYPDPRAASVPYMRYYIHASEESVDALRAAFPEQMDEISGSVSEDDEAGRMKARLRSLLADDYEASDSEADQETVTLRTYWEPRTRDYPLGRMVLSTPETLLWQGPNPWANWPDAWVPIDTFRHHFTPDSYWGEGAVRDAIPLQRELNKSLSMIYEHRNLCANSPWLIPDDCHWDEDAVTGEQGEKIEVTPGQHPQFHKPERLPPPPPPTEIFQTMENLKLSIEDAFSYHDASQGQAPKNIQSGLGVELLQEKDELSSGPVVIRDQLAWQCIGQRILRLVHENWTNERTVRATGRDLLPSVMSFKGTNIPERLDVVVESDTLLPTTRVGRTNTILAMVQNGMLTPEQGTHVIFSGFGQLSHATKEATEDAEKQRRENRMLERGQLPEVAGFDVHDEHLRVLNSWRKSPAFESIQDQPVQGYQPPVTIGELAEAHAESHLMHVLQNEMAQAQLGRPTEEPGAESAPESQPSQAEASREPEEAPA